jgi:hypothetical protein
VTTARHDAGYHGRVVRIGAVPERLVQGVAERVVALVVDSLDLDALLARVDIDAVLDRIDVERLLDRVDIDRLLERVDANALLARIDLAAAMADATKGTAGVALTSLRGTSRRADESVARWSDRLLGRT